MGSRIKREDQVIVISGKAKGQKGKVIQVLKKKDRVIIEGVNRVKKHEKPNPKNEQGGIVDREMPVHISNVMLLSPTSNEPVKVVSIKNKEGKKVRAEKSNLKNIID